MCIKDIEYITHIFLFVHDCELFVYLYIENDHNEKKITMIKAWFYMYEKVHVLTILTNLCLDALWLNHISCMEAQGDYTGHVED